MDADSGEKKFPIASASPCRAHCATKENMMTPTSEQIAPHMARFLDMLGTAFRRYGVPDGLPERFRDAVAATPRHMFVHRFRLSGGPLRDRIDEGVLRDNDADPIGELADIYSDAVMIHVDAAGERLPSTNSQPSYVLWLLDLLDLRPGQCVLEIGSGSGWLAAVMARLVGEGGHVTGIEIIPQLAAQSQADLARLGIDNTSVLAADGAQGHAAGVPFDRVMITAACWDLPAVLFDQVAEGGRVLVPVELRGGGCQVTVLRREGERFVAERAAPGWFVPLLGPGQQRPALRLALAELPFWDEIGRLPPRRVPLPLVGAPDGAAVCAFCAFLGRTAAGFAIFGDGDPPEQPPWLPAEPFGILDQAEHSVALWSRGELLAYGGASAMRALAQAYANWTSYGLPGLAGFALQVVRIGSAPVGNGRVWTEPRGDTALVWRLLSGAEDWKALLCHAP
jgi:protein-L-isoaspartate(D-aspartate) O-methyltransferase